ncbi:MAG: lipid-A-disaccharide synthase, partial [Gammaproteobacteria bacterium]
AIMPGSRQSEFDKLIDPFIKTAVWCLNKNNNLHFIVGLINAEVKEIFLSRLKLISPKLPVTVFVDQSLDVMEAADVILLASGTVALEAMLLKRPMVVAYKLNWLTYQIAKIMVNVPYISLPNILVGDQIVPECIQEHCTPEIMGKELMVWLENKQSVVQLEQKFTDIHKTMHLPTNKLIANAVLDLVYD